MNRISLIQNLINEREYSVYLEIGTYKGVSFLPIKCATKIAVDPKIKISLLKKLKLHFSKEKNTKNFYFEMTSDSFFQKRKKFLEKIGKLDIVLVDGLHTFEASLKDVLNSLKHLDDNGVIIMHDCSPPHQAAATPASSGAEAKKMGVEGWTGTWCGDVWKTIVYLRKKYPDSLEAQVLNTDFGLGVINPLRKCKDLKLDINQDLFQEVNALEYEYLISNNGKAIGLKEVS